MQISHADTGPAKAGHYVRVRGRRWRVADIRPYDGCQLVTLIGVAPPEAGVRRQVLTPFDTIEPIDRPRRPRFVSAALWRRGCRALIAGDTPPGGLRVSHHARIDVMPHLLATGVSGRISRRSRHRSR